MFVIVALIVITTLVGLAAAFGLGRDTRQSGREWYPAGPDVRR
jgi:hypothetical protein